MRCESVVIKSLPAKCDAGQKYVLDEATSNEHKLQWTPRCSTGVSRQFSGVFVDPKGSDPCSIAKVRCLNVQQLACGCKE